jgi:hypothetical protein
VAPNGTLEEDGGEDGGEDGSPPAAPDDEEEALTGSESKRQRGFTSKMVRENERLREQLARQEALNAYLAEQAQARRAPPQERPAPPPQYEQPSQLRAPRQQDYNFERADEVARWNVDVERYWRGIAREEHLAAQLERDEYLMQQDIQALHQQVNRRVEEGRNKYDDFDEAIDSINARLQGQPVFGVLKQYAAQSPKGSDVLRYVGRHPEVMQELRYRTVEGAEQYLSKLEAQLGKAANGASRQAARTGGALPPAVQPLTGGGGIARPQGSAPQDIANGSGSFLDYWRAMKGQEKSRR